MNYTQAQIKELLKNGANGIPQKYLISEELRQIWKREGEDVRSHYNGDKPDKLFKERFPSEREEYRKYREANFQPITRASILRGLGALYRIFSQANHSLDFEQDLAEYMTGAKFGGLHFSQYIFKTFITQSVCDPNGYLVVLPKKAVPSGRDEVELVSVHSSDIYIDPQCHDGLMLFKMRGKLDETVKGVRYTKGQGYWLITNNQYYKYLETVGKDGKAKKLLIPFCPNRSGEVTAVRNGGIPANCQTDFDQYTYQISYFAHAIPYLNEARIDHTLHQVNKVLNGSPKLVVGGTSCNGCNGQPILGQEWNEEKQCNVPILCEKCNGFGFIKPESQFDAVEVLPPTNDALAQSYKFVYDFITVPIDNLEHFGKEVEKNINKADEVLLLRFIQEAQSGKAKEIDREEKYSSFYSISDYIFDTVMTRVLEWIDNIRHQGRPVGFTVHKPISFQIKSETALWEELCQKLEKNAPQGDIIATYFDYLGKRYATNKKMQKIERFCVLYEPHYIHTIGQRQQLQASENIDRQTSIRATRVLGILLRISERLKGQFMQRSYEQIAPLIEKEIQPYLPNETEDLSGEHKRLRGLVGTMANVRELQKSVTEGLIDKEEAISSMMQFLGFSYEEAAELIGDANPEPKAAEGESV